MNEIENIKNKIDELLITNNSTINVIEFIKNITNEDFLIDLYKMNHKEQNIINYCISSNIHTPSYILDELSENINLDIKINISNNINTSSDTLEKLSNSDEGYVRYGVAMNNNSLINVLEKLCEDNFIPVREQAIKRITNEKEFDAFDYLDEYKKDESKNKNNHKH